MKRIFFDVATAPPAAKALLRACSCAASERIYTFQRMFYHTNHVYVAISPCFHSHDLMVDKGFVLASKCDKLTLALRNNSRIKRSI